MIKEYNHLPVLADSVLENLNIKPDGIYVDATFGRGGHAKQILSKLGSNGRLLVMDKDPEALEVANALAKQDKRVTVLSGCFATLTDLIRAHGLEHKIDAILIDIGVSSPQLDNPDRGFSFMHDGPLDMRMSQSGESAQDWLNQASESEIAQIIKMYGEEPFARRIARNIVMTRESQPLTRTQHLVDIVGKSVPKKVQFKQNKHVATKTFQAVRMHVNQELSALKLFLQSAPEVLAPMGRIAVITFHSLEDRVVKAQFQELTTVQVPKRIPLREDQMVAPFAWVLKKAVASSDELSQNIRARTAKLRVIEKQQNIKKGSIHANSTQTFIA